MEKSRKKVINKESFLENENIFLRQPEPEDLDFLYKIENHTEFWHVSETKAPLSKWHIRQHIENSKYDIFTNKELRLIIEDKKSKEKVGIVDIFEFDPHNSRAGIGIIIDKANQKKGYASQTIKLITDYAFNFLFLNQLFCNIDKNNEDSVNLFLNSGFEKSGTLRKWKKHKGGFSDVVILQYLNSR